MVWVIVYTNYCPCWWDTTKCEGCGRQVERTMHRLCFCSCGTEVWRACKLALPCIVKESWSFVDTFSRLRTSWEAQPELLGYLEEQKRGPTRRKEETWSSNSEELDEIAGGLSVSQWEAEQTENRKPVQYYLEASTARVLQS